jgi:hypothetical protein
MNKEILEKIKEIKDSCYMKTTSKLVDELEQLVKAEEPQEKPECDFIPGQVLKVWNNDPEYWDIDVLQKYKYGSKHPFVCRRFDWAYAEPLPLKNLVACIAYYIPDAVKAIVDVGGDFYFENSDTIMGYRIPYPNNTGKDIEIEIKR